MAFSVSQQDHVRKQLAAHQRESGVWSIVLDADDNVSLDVIIDRGVFASDLVSGAIYLARFLYAHQNLYRQKDVLDLGCGAGTQGLIMALYGARSVDFADINPKATANVVKNVQQLALPQVNIYTSDLFAAFPLGKLYDLIVFNHPFFPGEAETFEADPMNDEMLRRSMLGGTELIKTFFQNVHAFLKPGGLIVMPYFDFAGPENDPATHLKYFNLQMIKRHAIASDIGLQPGGITIDVIGRLDF